MFSRWSSGRRRRRRRNSPTSFIHNYNWESIIVLRNSLFFRSFVCFPTDNAPLADAGFWSNSHKVNNFLSNSSLEAATKLTKLFISFLLVLLFDGEFSVEQLFNSSGGDDELRWSSCELPCLNSSLTSRFLLKY